MDTGSLQLLGFISLVVIGLWLLPAMVRGYLQQWFTMKYKSNVFLWLLTGSGAIALAWALLTEHHPKGFFVAVRVVVCFASTYAAVAAYKTKREIWTWLLGANAALYNPFVPVHLTREVWNFVGLADITLLIAAGILLRTRDESSSADDSSNGFFSKNPWGSGIIDLYINHDNYF